MAAGIHAALRFADDDPEGARLLTIQSAVRRVEGRGEFAEMVDRLAALLRHGAPSTKRPKQVARTIVLRLARQTFLQVDSRPGVSVAEIAPDLIAFALVPYVTLPEAQRWSAWDPPEI